MGKVQLFRTLEINQRLAGTQEMFMQEKQACLGKSGERLYAALSCLLLTPNPQLSCSLEK